MNRRDFHTDYADELAGITEGGEMKTAMQHLADEPRHYTESIRLEWIESIMLDSYRAGMEAAAGLLDARAKESNVAGTMLFYGMGATLIRTAAKTAQLPTV